MKPPNKVLETAHCFLIILIPVVFSDSTLNPWFNSEFRDVTPMVESPFIREDNIVDLDIMSLNCGRSTSFGKICDYSQTNKTIRLPTGLKYSQEMPSFIELKIQDASALHVYPTCISWLQITRAGYVKTFPAEKQSSVLHEDCRTWLRIYDSTVDEISHGVLDVTLMNSKVSKMNLKNQRDIMAYNSTIDHIEWLDWKGYKGHIANSSINKITKMIANSDLMILNSNIGVLEFDSVIMNNSDNQIYGTKFNVIHSFGLTFRGKNNELRNVTINKLHKYGVITGPYAGLTLSNVNILKANSPAFAFHSPELITFENVTIEGEPLELNSKWIESETENVNEISSGSKACVAEGSSYVCNLKNLNEYKMYFDFDSFNSSTPVKNLTIKNGNIIELANIPCNLSLTLIHCNVSGSIHSKAKVLDEECRSTFTARHCDIGYIQSWNFNILDFENVKIKSLNSSQVTYVHLKHSEINEVRSLVTREDSRVCIQYSKLGKITYALFNEPIKLEHSQISSITGNLTLNHEEESSLFLNSSIDYIGYQGLYLSSGCLQIIDVKMRHMQEQSIFLEKDACLSINNSFSFPRLGLKSVSVLKHEQASVTIPSLPIKTTDWVFYIRQPHREENGSSAQRFHLNNSTVDSNSFCEGSGTPLPEIKCDFENMEVEIEITYALHLTLQNISYMALHPSCSSLIYLIDVLNGTILLSDSELCKTSIHIQSSGIHEMRGGTKDFLANSSHIETFIPTDEPFGNILILNSTISSIEGLEYTGINEVSQSTINNLHMMNGLSGSELWIFDSKINLIDVFGIIIEKGFVFNSVIEYIDLFGVTISGAVNITNTTIKNAEHESIIIDGVLNLQNVIIENGSISSFFLGNGLLKCQNVSVNGQKILSKDIIFNEKSSKTKTDSNENNNELTTKKVTNKKVIRVTESPVTESPVEIMSDPKEDEPPTTAVFKKYISGNSGSMDHPSSSLSWLFGILGFLIGAALMFGIVYAYVLFRPDVQNISPTVRWKVTDDEHDLIPSDDEAMGERI